MVPELTTPGNFLFGGCGLGAALVALEAASGRPTVWSTAQYLSYAPTDSVLDLTVTLAADGRRVTQGRVVGYVGDTEILTVNAALGLAGRPRRRGRVGHRARRAPARRVPAPAPPRLQHHVDLRPDRRPPGPGAVASRRSPRVRPVRATRTSALWARVPGHLEPSAATLAIIGDYVTGGVSQPLGRRVMSRSLDNTLRVVRLEPTEWMLCDIRIQALVGRLRPGDRLPLVGAGRAAGHGQSVDERAGLGLTSPPSRSARRKVWGSARRAAHDPTGRTR